MPKACAVTGKKARFQKTSTRKGSPKRKGGVGLKAVGVHSRTVKPNLHKKALSRGGKPFRVWLSAKALRQLDLALLVNPGRQRRE